MEVGRGRKTAPRPTSAVFERGMKPKVEKGPSPGEKHIAFSPRAGRKHQDHDG